METATIRSIPIKGDPRFGHPPWEEKPVAVWARVVKRRRKSGLGPIYGVKGIY